MVTADEIALEKKGTVFYRLKQKTKQKKSTVSTLYVFYNNN